MTEEKILDPAVWLKFPPVTVTEMAYNQRRSILEVLREAADAELEQDD